MLDLSTLLVTYSTTTLILSLALLLAARSQRRFPGLELWSAGGLLIGSAPLQLAAQGQQFRPFEMITVTLAIISGMACLSAGMARYTATRFRRPMYLSFALIWVAYVTVAAWTRPPMQISVTLISLLVCGMSAETGLQLARRRRLMELPAHRVTAGLFFFLAAGSVVRAITALFFNLGLPEYGAPVVHPVGLLAFQLIHTTLGMSLLVMVWSRLDRELQAHVGTLEEQVGCDHLTGALNRRGFWGYAEPLLESAQRHRQPISVICLDIDHFKRVNDTFGHSVGDEVLKALVHCVRGHLRASDHLGRLGGEEFTIILPETPLDGAVALAERLRLSVQDTPVHHDGGVIRFTCSFGVAQRLPHEEPLTSILTRADLALYEAKRAGRNLVRAARSGIAAEPATVA